MSLEGMLVPKKDYKKTPFIIKGYKVRSYSAGMREDKCNMRVRSNLGLFYKPEQ